jgi:hypothetical protein
VLEGVNNYYCEGRVLVVKILKLVKSLKKVHYVICSGKINTLELNPSAYLWKGKELLFFFTTTLGRKM